MMVSRERDLKMKLNKSAETRAEYKILQILKCYTVVSLFTRTNMRICGGVSINMEQATSRLTRIAVNRHISAATKTHLFEILYFISVGNNFSNVKRSSMKYIACNGAI